MCGVPAQDQLLHVVTQEGNRPLQDGTKLPDYFPDVRNRCELVMVDSVPDRDVKKAKQGEAGGKKSMGADSVLSMARMFQAVRHRLLHITLTPSLLIYREKRDAEREREMGLAAAGTWRVCCVRVSILTMRVCAAGAGAATGTCARVIAQRPAGRQPLDEEAGLLRGLLRDQPQPIGGKACGYHGGQPHGAGGAGEGYAQALS
jgi:hypothetical protein